MGAVTYMILFIFCGFTSTMIDSHDLTLHPSVRKIRKKYDEDGTNVLKKAIVPNRRAHLMEKMEEELEQYHHNETRRPEFPQHDVSPDMIFKYPMVPDPPLVPCSANDSSCGASLQPVYVVPPPAPPPPPTIIQTGSGPAATVTQAMPSPPKIDTNDVLQKILKKRPITGAGGIVNLSALMAGAGPGGEGTGGADGGGGGGGGGKSGPAQGGEAGLFGPMVGSGSGDGEMAPVGITHGADWTGIGAPSPGAKYAGSLTGPSYPSPASIFTGLPGADGTTAGGPDEAFASLVMKIGGFCCKNGNNSALCKQLTQFNKNFKCFQKVAKEIESANVETSSPNSKPLQMVRGFLGAELFRLEDIISNLNKKIDIIGDRVTKRPNQLARASLMAGMTSTFGDLQNTIELLNKKLDRRLQPEQADMVISNDPQYLQDQHAKVKELNILSKQLDQLGGAGWLGSKGFGLGLNRYEEELKEKQLRGREEAQLKSSERLEKLMHLVADRLTGLSSLMDSHPTVYEESAASDLDPVVRQEEERLMYKQLQIQGQMGLIQAALRSLTGALAKMEANKQQVTSAIPQFIKIVQTVLGKAASTFQGVALQNTNSGNHLVQSLDQHIHHADVIGDHLLSAGHSIDSKLEPLHQNDAEGIKGLVEGLASSYGNGATVNPFVGAPMGVVGANEPVPSESIPQLAASIASLPSSDDHLLDTNRIREGTSSGNAFASTAIDKYLETNPANFGHAGFGVVTGNLGGSLGLGGIGGIDGGNALTVNQTVKTKRTLLGKFQHEGYQIRPKNKFKDQRQRDLVESKQNISVNRFEALSITKYRKNGLIKHRIMAKGKKSVDKPITKTKRDLILKQKRRNQHFARIINGNYYKGFSP